MISDVQLTVYPVVSSDPICQKPIVSCFSGLRSIGCSIVSGLFVLFNMFYLQPKLATPNVPALRASRSSTGEDDVPHLNEADISVEKKVKILEARRIMLFSLGGIFLVMAASRFFYGISSNFDKPTCFVLLFIGKFTSSLIPLHLTVLFVVRTQQARKPIVYYKLECKSHHDNIRNLPSAKSRALHGRKVAQYFEHA